MPPPRKPTDVSQKERNEYIPNFIAKKPFYVTEDSTVDNDYLEHQRLQTTADQKPLSKWYDRGRKAGPAATKYRKGACENCGALTHKTKDCLDRPRKHGAKWTGRDIQADEVIQQDPNQSWDAKRDRWNGYDPSQHNVSTEEPNEPQHGEMSLVQAPEDDGDEGARYEEETDMGRQQATSTRNLRIREDTAKYLLNLDLDSAKYDPKTRSMVDSGVTQDQAAALVAEEGFMKASGDAAEFETAQRYAWESQERGDKAKIHLQANPTAGAYLQKKEREANEIKRTAQQEALLNKYGDQKQFTIKPAESAVVESERYVEYDERGRVKNKTPVAGRSQYPEDIMTKGHTTVWGSWWKDKKWGYACCFSTVKNEICHGEEGKRAFEQGNQLVNAQEDVEKLPKSISWEDQADLEKKVQNDYGDDTKLLLDNQSRKRGIDGIDVDDDSLLETNPRKRIADNRVGNPLGREELVA